MRQKKKLQIKTGSKSIWKMLSDDTFQGRIALFLHILLIHLHLMMILFISNLFPTSPTPKTATLPSISYEFDDVCPTGGTAKFRGYLTIAGSNFPPLSSCPLSGVRTFFSTGNSFCHSITERNCSQCSLDSQNSLYSST